VCIGHDTTIPSFAKMELVDERGQEVYFTRSDYLLPTISGMAISPFSDIVCT
jgi:hypothetical protein